MPNKIFFICILAFFTLSCTGPSTTVSDIIMSQDFALTKGKPDAGYLVTFIVTNSGDRGKVKLMPSLSCSEGTWNRSQEIIMEAGEIRKFSFLFHEPTINATNPQTLITVKP